MANVVQCLHLLAHVKIASIYMQICPKKGKFFVATYSGPWKFFNRHNEILFVKKPKGGKKERKEELSQFTFNDNLMGWEALDVEDLFQEEFHPLDLPEMEGVRFEDMTDIADVDKKPSENKQELASVDSAVSNHDGVQTS